jgi:hypothetical protein
MPPRVLQAGAVTTGGYPTTRQQHADTVRLKSREFIPAPGVDPALPSVASNPRHGLIQFYRIPSRQERNILRRTGVELFTYLPDRAFLARLPANLRLLLRVANVRYIGPLHSTDKIDPRLLKEGVNSYARNRDGTLRLLIRFFEDVAMRDAAALISAHSGRITETIGDFHIIRADVPERELRRLLDEDKVQWVEDVFEKQLLNDKARAAMRVDQVQAAPYGLDGTGSVIGEWDGGHAVDSFDVAFHQDLAGRVTRGDGGQFANNGHATHVAGTAIGSGLLSAANGGTPFQWKGMAPNAKLISFDWHYFLSEYSSAIGTHHIDLSTNSWRDNAPNGYYGSESSALDWIITGYYGKPILIFWAAGNQREGPLHACNIDLDLNVLSRYDAYDCIASLASGKNTITVGSINAEDDSIADTTSWGPTDDGRLKPEIVAPGCKVSGGTIKSTVPGDAYGTSCGTSMATPAAAGSTALLFQRFRQLCSASGVPLPSTIKALLIHGARDLDDATAWYNRGPDFASGYGRIDLPRSIDLVPFQIEDTISQLGLLTYPIVVAPQQNLKVTLAWDDYYAAANAAPALVNDLDLELVDPNGGIHLPWVLDPANPNVPAIRAVDSRNVVEQVLVDNVPPALAGIWTVRVKGTNVPTLTQKFSLVSELLPLSSCTGPLPDADIWGADTSLDLGFEPDSDPVPMWISDDIRVRLAPPDGPHQNPELGQTNYVYVTVRNRGTQTAPYARVFLYWADGSTGLGWPTDWNQLGSATAVSVPAGGSTVIGPILWNPIGTGHYCLYARMVTHNEPIV